jgi:hypothetical protein
MVNFIQTCTPDGHNLTAQTLQKDPLESCKDCNGGSEILFQEAVQMLERKDALCSESSLATSRMLLRSHMRS